MFSHEIHLKTILLDRKMQTQLCSIVEVKTNKI